MCDTAKMVCGICAKTVNGITLTCKYCFYSYHPTCKKIIGANIKKHLNNYFCSDVCQASYDRIIAQREHSSDTGADNELVQQLKSFMTLKFNELQLSIDTALSENKELTRKVEELSKKCVSLENTVENLKYDADGVQRVAVRNNITILGVPPSMDSKAAFGKLCEVVGHPVGDNDVRNIKSYKNKVTKATTTVIVEFSSYQAKRDFLAKKKIKGKVTAAELTGDAAAGNRSRLIFIRDELTKRGMALYAELRDIRKLVKIKYCWTRDGDVFARVDDDSKFICVKSSFDIQNLANTAERINEEEDDN